MFGGSSLSGREWRELREQSNDDHYAAWQMRQTGTTNSAGDSSEFNVGSISTTSTAAPTQVAKKPYPNVLPPPEPPLAWLFPDPKEDYAPLRLAGLWGSIGAALGVCRGIAFATFSERAPGFPRHRAFLMGFSLSAPWYISFFALAAVTDCYAARWQKPHIFDAAQAAGALGAGELG
mmetsp:Transcript_132670/g.343302  ORF Transcript_132670/g.343302 Transcript_132670/m.343302 type:complete len:177 (+) Transcript_132670:64-594(+)